jgi:hypothetical protein
MSNLLAKQSRSFSEANSPQHGPDDFNFTEIRPDLEQKNRPEDSAAGESRHFGR